MSKLKKLWIYILAFAMLVTCGLAFGHAYAKYVKQEGASSVVVGTDDDDLTYLMENAQSIKTPEDLLNAIQLGYTYIKFSDDVTDPFIITQEATNLNKSMLLDINGVEIQRNSRDPILKIPEGVTLTVMDSKSTGSLYNPVGSVLDVTGGTLTVKGGKFESGPRYWEYYSANATGIAQNEGGVRMWTNGEEGKLDYDYPIFTPSQTNSVKENGVYTRIDGNVYFDIPYTKGNGELVIPDDTYCYYITSDGLTSTNTVYFETQTNNPTFTYSYYVQPRTYEYISANRPATGNLNEDFVQVMVYGYERNIRTAIDIGETMVNKSQYAAIRMEAGQLTVNAPNPTDYTNVTEPKEMTTGCFISYFGVAQTSCIYMTGGNLLVEDAGAFVTLNPEYIQALGGNTEAKLAYMGRGACIATSENNTGMLTIKGGLFRSYNLNCVLVQNGTIRLEGGTFQKRSTLTKTDTGRAAVFVGAGQCDISNAKFYIRSTADGYLTESGVDTQQKTTNDYWGNNIYALYTSGGALTVTDSDFTIDGDYATGLFSSSSNGSVTLTGVNMTMTGDNVYGLYATGGTINMYPGAHDTAWTLGATAGTNNTGSYSYGVYTQGGKVTMNGVNMLMPGDNAYGFYSVSSQQGDFVKAISSTYELRGDNSVGVHAQGGEVVFEGDGSRIAMTGANAIGIESAGGNISSTDVAYRFSGAKSGAIKVQGGSLTLSKGSVTMSGTNSSGIYSQGGHILSKEVPFRISGDQSFGIYATAGDITLYKSDLSLTSVNNCYGIIGVSNSTTENLMVDMINSGIAVGGEIAATGHTLKGWTAYDRRENTSVEYGASMGLFLANLSSGSDCYVSLDGCNLYSADIGMGVRSGTVFVQNGGIIQAAHSTAVAVDGGDVYFGNVTEKKTVDTDVEVVDIDSVKQADGEIDRSKIIPSTGDKTVAMESTLYAGYTFTSPNPSADNLRKVSTFLAKDGIYLQGGNLIAHDRINLDFKGLQNDVASTYMGSQIKSYALRVKIGENIVKDTTVILPKGHIENSVGGGVFVDNASQTAACTVTLGVANAVHDESGVNNLAVITTGTTVDDSVKAKFNDEITVSVNGKEDWKFKSSLTGGHAIYVNSGTLNVLGGYYRSEMGNGILVQGALGKTDATIENGQFFGKDSYIIERYDYRSFVGPCASYSLKQLGGKLTVNGGIFGGTYTVDNTTYTTGNGVFIMGDPTSGSTAEADFNRAKINASSRGIIILNKANVRLGNVGNDEQGVAYKAEDFLVKGAIYAVGFEALSEACGGTEDIESGRVEVYSGTFDAHERTTVDWENNNAFYVKQGQSISTHSGSYYHSANHHDVRVNSQNTVKGLETLAEEINTNTVTSNYQKTSYLIVNTNSGKTGYTYNEEYVYFA